MRIYRKGHWKRTRDGPRYETEWVHGYALAQEEACPELRKLRHPRADPKTKCATCRQRQLWRLWWPHRVGQGHCTAQKFHFVHLPYSKEDGSQEAMPATIGVCKEAKLGVVRTSESPFRLAVSGEKNSTAFWRQTKGRYWKGVYGSRGCSWRQGH